MIQRFFFVAAAVSGMRPTAYPVSADYPEQPYTSYTSDPCQRLCEEFSASNRGNGFDLCDAPQGSQCIDAFPGTPNDERICANLYWQRTEDGIAGLVYEIDPSQIHAITVTCDEALVTLGEAPAYVGLDDPNWASWNDEASYEIEHEGRRSHEELEIESIFDEGHDNDEECSLTVWDTAVQIFAHLPPVQRAIHANPDNHFLQLIREYESQITIQSDGPTIAPTVFRIMDLFRDRVTPHVMNIIGTFIETAGIDRIFETEIESTLQCTNCGEGYTGSLQSSIRLRRPPNHDNESPVSLQQLLSRSFHHTAPGLCAYCPSGSTNVIEEHIATASEIIAFEMPRGIVVSIPSRLAVGGNNLSQYRLVAIAHQFPDGHFEADIKHYDQWYRINSNLMTQTRIEDGAIFSTVLAIFYTRID